MFQKQVLTVKENGIVLSDSAIYLCWETAVEYTPANACNFTMFSSPELVLESTHVISVCNLPDIICHK